MAVTGGEPLSAENLKSVVDALIARQDNLAATFATVAMYLLESSGSAKYRTAFRLVSSNGINVSISGSYAEGCTFTFPTYGVYQVDTAAGFLGRVVDSRGQVLMNINGAQTFNWDATSGQQLILTGTYTNFGTESQVTVQRIS